jgi:hypothetical protein
MTFYKSIINLYIELAYTTFLSYEVCYCGGLKNIVQCLGYLTSSEHQLYSVSPLKTPVRLLIGLLQSQSHVTTITHNYFLCCATFTQLTISHVRNCNHLFHSYTFTRADFSASDYYLKLSHTLHLHTSRVCLLSRPHS